MARTPRQPPAEPAREDTPSSLRFGMPISGGMPALPRLRPTDFRPVTSPPEAAPDPDALYPLAVSFVITNQAITSPAHVQRHLLIGYKLAERLLERMARDGFVGPANTDARRPVLVGAYAAQNIEGNSDIEILNQKDYDDNIMEAKEHLLYLFAESGLTIVQLREAINEYKSARAPGGTVVTAAARSETAAAEAALAWPSEKWENSPERGSRKQGAIITYLRRVWVPFIDKCGFPVTRPMVAEHDPAAAAALKAYARSIPLPDDIRIVRSRDLKEIVSRPDSYKGQRNPHF